MKADTPLTPAQAELPFSRVPDPYHINVFGVPYIRNPDVNGGFLYVTRWGWHRLAHLSPENWFEQRRFVKEGTRLRGSTGTVYYYPSRPEGAAPMDLLIKVSRLAEDVPGKLATDNPEVKLLNDASFNSPFQEFGMVEELRASTLGPPELHIRTKRPLAIYCAHRDLPSWQLGRKKSDFLVHGREMDRDQEQMPEGMRIRLMENRQYFMLYAWVPGVDAQEAMEKGLMDDAELHRLSERVNRELAEKGFRILDNKPKHFILRIGRDGELIRFRDELLYVQVDFELLQRTQAYKDFHLKPQPDTYPLYFNEYSQL
jgi:hypothetical protein